MALDAFWRFGQTQDKETCVVFGMPQAALQAGAAKDAVPLERIAERVTTEIFRLRAAAAP